MPSSTVSGAGPVPGLLPAAAVVSGCSSPPAAGSPRLPHLDETLRLRLREGRSYAFTGSSPDARLAFHRKVDAARRRVAGGAP